MQLGSFTVPPLALAAVVGAGVLAVLVLWGVWRARRAPALDPLPVAPPDMSGRPQPCSEDWTGEAAGGPADPPGPARPRTVADVVAARVADTGPLPGLPVPSDTAGPATVDVSADDTVGRHAVREPAAAPADLRAPADERPDGTTLARTREEPAGGRRRPRPAPDDTDSTARPVRYPAAPRYGRGARKGGAASERDEAAGPDIGRDPVTTPEARSGTPGTPGGAADGPADARRVQGDAGGASAPGPTEGGTTAEGTARAGTTGRGTSAADTTDADTTDAETTDAGLSGADTTDAGPSGAGLSGAGTSGAGSVGAGSVGAGTSGAGPSGAKTSGAGTSGAGAVGADTIGAATTAPGTAATRMAAAGAAAGAAAAGLVAAGAAGRDGPDSDAVGRTAAPDATTPGDPGARSSANRGDAEPDAAPSGAANPYAAPPLPANPDAANPYAANQDAANPYAANQEAANPDAANRDAGNPDVVNPHLVPPRVASAGRAPASATSPSPTARSPEHPDRPGPVNPEAPRSGTGRPDAVGPGSDAGHPGIDSPSSASGEALSPGAPEPAPAQAEDPGAEPARPAPDRQVVDGSAPEAPAADRTEAVGPLPPWSAERTVPAREDLPSGDEGSAGDTPGTGTDDDVARTAAEAPPAPGGPVTPISPEPVSRAVQQALAARAVRRARMLHAESEGADPSTGEQQELPLAVVPSAPSTPAAESDVRDRLLGVLLADPARALDAARRLDDSRERIEQLGDVLRRRREDLAGAVRHLNDCGLDPVQIGRLAGMATADVRTILDGEDAGRG